MTESATTHFSNQASILGELWLNYRDDENFDDFVSYNDLGLPLAYAISAGIVDNNPTAEKFVRESFELLLAALDIEDVGFETLDEMFGLSEDSPE